MLAVLAFIVVLGLLVFVHEAGHFIAAKRSGMDVEEFGFGFPPRLIGIQRVSGKLRLIRGGHGGEIRDARSAGSAADCTSDIAHRTSTLYSLNWLPLGGFVRIKGENGGDADDPRSFAGQPRWRRAIVLVAGVAMNAVLAMVLFSSVFAIGAPQVIDGTIPTGAVVRDAKTTIVAVLPDSPAANAGLEAGDVVLSVDGETNTEPDAVRARTTTSAGAAMMVEVLRGDVRETVTLTPAVLPGTDQVGIGVQLIRSGIVRYPLHRAFVQGVRMTGTVLGEVLRALGGLVYGLIVERTVAVDVAGPIGIAVLTGQVAALGIVHLLQFTAVLSANLALLNIFPFPALDGGRLFLLMIEAVRHRALTKRVENIVHATGFVLLMLLVLVVTYRDIVTFGGGILQSIRSVVGF